MSRSMIIIIAIIIAIIMTIIIITVITVPSDYIPRVASKHSSSEARTGGLGACPHREKKTRKKRETSRMD
jgi:hypothetical protein